jgi:hypothetical protein
MSGPRTRTTSEVLVAGKPWSFLYKGWASNYWEDAIPQTFTGTSDDVVRTRTMNDVVVDNFRKRISQGEIINNPMKIVETIVYPPDVCSFSRRIIDKSVHTPPTYTGHWQEGTLAPSLASFGDLLDFEQDVASMRNSLISQAVAKAHANASSSELSLLMVAAESRKSIESLTQIFLRVVKIVKAARRLDMKYLKRQISLRELEDRYMELRYAIRPLVYDTKGVMKAFEKSQAYKTTRCTARGFAKDTIRHNDQTEVNVNNSAVYTVGRSFFCEIDVRAGILTDVETSKISIWGLDQFLETGWEVTPFSFIVDWFFNIGTLIAAYAPSAGVTQLASWVTYKQTVIQCNTILSSRNYASYNYADMLSVSGDYSINTKTTERTVDPSLGLLPTFNLRLDALKLIDLTIILKRYLKK